MDELAVSALIAEGENSGRVDFKREIHLDVARDKAEFVKDIISLANSAPDGGFLIVGVDDAKHVVGIDGLEEERIQQIAQTYITPLVSLRCLLVLMTLESPLSVGVVEVKARSRPHQVARSIDKLRKDEVFVRHGSVVEKASPEEIIQMNDGDPRQQREIRNLIRAAETHKELGNFDLALAAYTRAIEIAPTSEHFLSRGELRLHHFKTTYMNRDQMAELGNVAYKDFEDAFVLAENVDQEKRARFGRAEISANHAGPTGYNDDWDEDIAWLRKNTKGRELGKALYLDVVWADLNVGIDAEDWWLAQINDAITVGYTEPHIFCLRAFAHFRKFNYGLALKDLDKALETPLQWADPWAESIFLKATILAKMKRYDEAFQVFYQARNRVGSDVSDSSGYLESDIDLLCRSVLVRMFSKDESSGVETAKLLIKSLRHILDYEGSGSIQQRYPLIATALRIRRRDLE